MLVYYVSTPASSPRAGVFSLLSFTIICIQCIQFLYLKLRNSAWPLEDAQQIFVYWKWNKKGPLSRSFLGPLSATWARSGGSSRGSCGSSPFPISRSRTPILYYSLSSLCVPCTSCCDGDAGLNSALALTCLWDPEMHRCRHMCAYTHTHQLSVCTLGIWLGEVQGIHQDLCNS